MSSELRTGEDAGTDDPAMPEPGGLDLADLTPREQREREFYERYYRNTNMRQAVRKYYTVNADTLAHQRKLLTVGCEGKRYLEYGCGLGGFAYEMARAGAITSGFDLSERGIERCREQARGQGLDIDFQVMNAHHTDYPDNSFDLISGLGILHHLDLDLAYAELARLLKPGGYALFFEALGNNPLINLYRKLTPQMRTPDERPLRMKDAEKARRCFGRVDFEFHHFWTLGAVPFRKLSGFPALLNNCRKMDQAMFRFLPFMRSQAWMLMMFLREPKKQYARCHQYAHGYNNQSLIP